MNTKIQNIGEVNRYAGNIISEEETSYAVGQKWINTDTNVEGLITGIDETIVSLDDRKGQLSSVEHMNRRLWRHLINIGVYKKLS